MKKDMVRLVYIMWKWKTYLKKKTICRASICGCISIREYGQLLLALLQCKLHLLCRCTSRENRDSPYNGESSCLVERHVKFSLYKYIYIAEPVRPFRRRAVHGLLFCYIF